jgi:hypothetical protein
MFQQASQWTQLRFWEESKPTIWWLCSTPPKLSLCLLHKLLSSIWASKQVVLWHTSLWHVLYSLRCSPQICHCPCMPALLLLVSAMHCSGRAFSNTSRLQLLAKVKITTLFTCGVGTWVLKFSEIWSDHYLFVVSVSRTAKLWLAAPLCFQHSFVCFLENLNLLVKQKLKTQLRCSKIHFKL